MVRRKEVSPRNLSFFKVTQLALMFQAPPPLAPTGEEAIHQVIDVEPEAFADSEEAGSLEQAYEVDLTLQEIEKGGYQRVSRTLNNFISERRGCSSS